MATRWYRAPEILLGSLRYGLASDIWSFGCILGELLLGRPVFPGSSTLNQLSRIIEMTGRPSIEELREIQSPLAIPMFESLDLDSEKKKLEDIFPCNEDNALAIDLLKHCLVFTPS